MELNRIYNMDYLEGKKIVMQVIQKGIPALFRDRYSFYKTFIY